MASLLDKRCNMAQDRIALVRAWLGGTNADEWKDKVKKVLPFVFELSFEDDWAGSNLEVRVFFQTHFCINQSAFSFYTSVPSSSIRSRFITK